jgi:ABC-type multidrug transport system permease subunit
MDCLRERAGKAYSSITYFFAKFVVELPYTLLFCFFFCCVLYWIAKLNSKADRFVCFFLTVMLQAVTVKGLGLAISAFAPSPETASAMATPFLIIGVLFGGFYMYFWFYALPSVLTTDSCYFLET